MRFLALTSLQTAVLALATTAIITALYFLKHRRQRFEVSSIQLWRRVIEHHLENSIFERLRRLLSIVLAIAIGLLVVLAIARPEVDLFTGKVRRMVIVLDTSPTMQTLSADGRTRFQHAVEAAQELIAHEAVTTQFRITDTTEQFDSPFTSERAEMRRLLSRMQPSIAAARLPDVAGTSATLITDGVSTLAIPAGMNSISVFEAAANVGVTAFEIRSIPSAPLAYEGYLEVDNFGKESRNVEINVAGSGEQRITKNVRIAPGGNFSEAMDLSAFDGGAVRATVHSDGDAFPLDDVAYAYLPVKRRAKALLVTPGNAFLETVLNAHPLIELSKTTSYTSAAPYDLVVFDRFAPATPPSRPALIIGAPLANWLPAHKSAAITAVSFETWMEDHPVLRGLSLHDVSVTRAPRIDAGSAAVLAADGRGNPLIVASERARWIMLAFDLQSSDFGYHDGFPVFIDNALRWFDHDRLALSRYPGTVSIPSADAEIRTADGSPVMSRAHMGDTVFDAPTPGLYSVREGESQHYVAVNLANRQYSDVNNSHIRESSRPPTIVPHLRHELWFYLLVGALLLLGLEWLTYHKRITV